MARHNLIFLNGIVSMIQMISLESGFAAIAYVTVARPQRDAGDFKDHCKTDHVTITSMDAKIVQEMTDWQKGDVVEVKGPITGKVTNKVSICTHCGVKNAQEGVLIYVNPIFAKRRGHIEDTDEQLQYLSNNREISNMAFVFGTLCVNPKKFTTKEGLIVTQYQIALNRKFRIRTDPPERKSDYPWVKSYGDNAIQDRLHLRIGSQIFVDGCVQARSVKRHSKCTACGADYTWKDRAMELVPFDTEYIANILTQEEIEAEEQKKREKAIREFQSMIGRNTGEIEDDQLDDEDYDFGIDTMDD